MNKRILVLLTVVALMVLLVFFVATAAIAKGEAGRGIACGKILEKSNPASESTHACLTT
jgi:hypothetical protein